jgi:hypothetical protein
MRSSKRQIPYTFQQRMSSETLPILSRAIPDFEIFMTEWEKFAADYPALKFWIDIGLHWAKKYYKRMDDTDAYVVTMCKSLTGYGTPLTANLNPQSLILATASIGLKGNGKKNISGTQKPPFRIS